VSQVSVIFYSGGQEIGSDDPAQQDYCDDTFSPMSVVVIGAGQSVTIPMETSKISGAAGGWTCSLGGWSS
jgi:hypothetical protein